MDPGPGLGVLLLILFCSRSACSGLSCQWESEPAKGVVVITQVQGISSVER